MLNLSNLVSQTAKRKCEDGRRLPFYNYLVVLNILK